MLLQLPVGQAYLGDLHLDVPDDLALVSRFPPHSPPLLAALSQEEREDERSVLRESKEGRKLGNRSNPGLSESSSLEWLVSDTHAP